MALASVSEIRVQEDHLPFEALMAGVSSILVNVRPDDAGSAITQILDRLCPAIGVDLGALIEFGADGAVQSHLTWGRRPMAAAESDPTAWNWLLSRVRLDERVPVMRRDEFPLHATSEREYARRMGFSTVSAVAISVRGVCLGALVFWSVQRPDDWQRLLQRSRLIAEIIGAALDRARREAAALAAAAEVEHTDASLTIDDDWAREEVRTFRGFDEIVGESVAMRIALERLAQVAPLNCSVLLQGETGTGKELFARALHDRSRRRGRALVRVNSAALPPTLVESELFGHEKGAFTGAVGLRQGRFELADGGTIFLDEIGDLPLEMQGKLLRVLQEGEFERVGSSRTLRVDARVVAATHHDLETAATDGRFRPDLYYRLSVFPIYVPALRERREDIPSLVWFFIHRHQRDMGRRIKKVPNDVMSALQQHDWPGNVRELENMVERALIRSTGDTLRLDETFAARSRERTMPASGTLDDVQRVHIESTLEQCRWRINGAGNAAERLGMHPNTLRFRMKKLGILSSQQRRAPAELR